MRLEDLVAQCARETAEELASATPAPVAPAKPRWARNATRKSVTGFSQENDRIGISREFTPRGQGPKQRWSAH